MDSQVFVKAETRNHKGFFVKQGAYKLKNIDESGWALICVDDTVCYYDDPDNLDTEDSEETVEA